MPEAARPLAGWLRVAGLGIATVIGGSFSGWNFGLAQGGWLGLALATVLMVGLYGCLVLVIAELAACLPTAGGLYAFVRVAFGRTAGFLAGISVASATLVASGAVATFVAGYMQTLFGVPPLPTIVALFAVFAVIHWFSANETLSVLLVVTCVSVATLVLFSLVIWPHFSSANLKDGALWLPAGLTGIVNAIPFAIWLLAGVEHTALAAEEVHNPRLNLPRGMILAILVLAAIGLAVLTLAPGAAGVARIGSSPNPLVDALKGAQVAAPLIDGIGFLVLPALLAGLFSLMFAYSRQTFALARAGYLPSMLARLNRHGVPTLAVYLPGALALGLALTSPGDTLLVAAVFLILLVYAACFASFLWFRQRAGQLSRPYRAPAGSALALAGMALTLLAAYACVRVALAALVLVIAFMGVAAVYVHAFARHRIDVNVPEEVFAADVARRLAAVTRLSGSLP